MTEKPYSLWSAFPSPSVGGWGRGERARPLSLLERKFLGAPLF